MKNRLTYGLFTLAAALTLGSPAAEKIFHFDFNSARFKRETISDILKAAAESGYTAILWEIEDKVRLDTISDCIHPDAMTKAEFREILAEAKALGLRAIPLMQTFGHVEYILKAERFRHLREVPYRRDCYCVLKPETRTLQRKMLDEYLDLFKDADVRWFHLGGDEAYAFGSCAACSKRPQMEIYAAHLDYMAQPLRARGIRPCVWNDMIVDPKREKDIDRMPKDFIIFHWDYYFGHDPNPIHWKEKLPFLLEHGFTVVFASASACGGDGPIMPDLKFHRINIQAGREEARKRNLAGFCVTSWSIRQSPKHMQIPLIRFGGTGRWELGPEYDALTRWDPSLCDLDGRGWHCFKDSTVPPPGHIETVLYRSNLEDPAFRTNAIATASSIRAGVLAALPKVSGQWKEGGELELAMLDCILAALKKTPMPETPFERHLRYLSEEQTPQSALNSARIVWGLYR